MSRMPFLGLASALFSSLFLLTCSTCRADYEAQLLRKFQNQNQSAAMKLKAEVADSLAQATHLRTSAPEKALVLLQNSLGHLQSDLLLTREERTVLIRQCQDLLQELEEMKASAENSQARVFQKDPGKTKDILEKEDPRQRRGVAQAFAGNVQVTPVVSDDRRFVRISLTGGFATSTVGAFFPGQGPIAISFSGAGATVPTGGTAVLAGYSSLAEARNEYGTPVLGKIPYLGRLFRNTGYGRSFQAVNITVSPRIIILQELDPILLGR